MIDEEGYRLNVGIIVVNTKGEVLWGRRKGMADAWQFPQGGIRENETPLEAMHRELREELGLMPEDVKFLAESESWLRYLLPKEFRRHYVQPLCIGQKQKWFLLRLISPESHIHLDYSEHPEFEEWRWVNYWYPINHVIEFKKEVYKNALAEFERVIKQ